MFRWLVAIFCFLCLLLAVAVVALSLRSMKVSDGFTYRRYRVDAKEEQISHQIILQSRDRCLFISFNSFAAEAQSNLGPFTIRTRSDLQSVPFYSNTRGPFYFNFQTLPKVARAHAWILTFPLWPLALALLGPPAFWIVVHRRRIRQFFMAKGLCLNCGYDLRATPQRCPECGMIPKTV